MPMRSTPQRTPAVAMIQLIALVQAILGTPQSQTRRRCCNKKASNLIQKHFNIFAVVAQRCSRDQTLRRSHSLCSLLLPGQPLCCVRHRQARGCSVCIALAQSDIHPFGLGCSKLKANRGSAGRSKLINQQRWHCCWRAAELLAVVHGKNWLPSASRRGVAHTYEARLHNEMQQELVRASSRVW